MARNLSWDIKQERDFTYFILEGSITEQTDFSALLQNPAQKIIVDLCGIQRINSAGVGEWISFVENLSSPPRQVILDRCSVPIVHQLNMISNMSGKAHVRSVILPYLCSSCEKDSQKTLNLDEEDPVSVQSKMTCPYCGDEMEFDDLPEVYFSFCSKNNTPKRALSNSLLRPPRPPSSKPILPSISKPASLQSGSAIPAAKKPASLSSGQIPAAKKPASLSSEQIPAATKPASLSSGQIPAATKPFLPSSRSSVPAVSKPASLSSGQIPAAKKPASLFSEQIPAASKPVSSSSGQIPAATKPASLSSGQIPAAKKPASSSSGQIPAATKPLPQTTNKKSNKVLPPWNTKKS